MDLDEFVNSVYLGDRGLKSIFIDGCNHEVKLQVTCISRVRGSSWDYYTEEDIDDGLIVFEGVTSIAFEPSGLVPNDFINEIRAERIVNSENRYLVTISVGSVDAGGIHKEVLIRIHADSMALEDPQKPRQRIRK